MLKKLLIIPWFGKYPYWLDQWVANMEYLKPMGYDYKIYSSLDLFKERVRERLGIEPNIERGSGKVWDYRPMFGVLFEKDIKGYDYWGHTDFDCVYGDVQRFIPDEELNQVDIWSNGNDHICGAWALYRNCKSINNFYKVSKDWKNVLEDKTVFGWEEGGYSNLVKKSLIVKYDLQQTKDWDNFDTLRFENGKLYEGDNEIMMAHFRHTKIWPKQIVV